MEDNSPAAPASRPIVLVANLGNRNVTYELTGQEIPLPDLFQQEGNRFDFRARTRQLVLDWAAKPLDIQSPFGVQIFADHLRPEVEAVHLFVTDQQTLEFPEGHHQDTLYAGELSRRILEEQYSTATELHAYTGDPTDEDAIYIYMAPVLRSILARYPAAAYEVHFVDAGGTPSMKTVAKSLLRYYRPEASIVYTPQAGKARPVSHQYHDRYVLLQVAREFVTTFQYRAAHDVLYSQQAGALFHPQLLTLLRVAALRKTFNRKAAQQVSTGRELPAVFAGYLKNSAELADDLVDFPKDFAEWQRLDIAELASLSQLYLQQQQYELGIPTYYRLCEEIGQCFAEHRGHSLRSNSDKETFVKATNAAVKQLFPFLDRYGAPYLLGYARAEGSSALQALLDEMTPTLSHVNGTPIQANGKRVPEKGLNVLRNRCFLAHGNEPITKATIEAESPGFIGPHGRAARIFHLLGLPTTNIYDQMNDEILALINLE